LEPVVVLKSLCGVDLQTKHVQIHISRFEIPGSPVNVESLEIHGVYSRTGLVRRRLTEKRNSYRKYEKQKRYP
jgi:hypothetical protein